MSSPRKEQKTSVKLMTVKIFNKEVMAPSDWLSELGNELNELINFRLRLLRHRTGKYPGLHWPFAFFIS